MRLFRRKDENQDGVEEHGGSGSGFSPDFLTVLARYGRFEFSPTTCDLPYDDRQTAMVVAMLNWAGRDLDGWASALLEKVRGSDGWVAYGAGRLTWDVLDRDADSPAVLELRDGSLRFMRDNGVPWAHLAPIEKSHWNLRNGKDAVWLVHIAPPPRESHGITPLEVGEERQIARLDVPTDNVVVLQHVEDGVYAQIIDSYWSEEDHTRVQREMRRFETLYDAHLEIGWSLQIPPKWCHPELLPYIPFPTPKVSRI